MEHMRRLESIGVRSGVCSLDKAEISWQDRMIAKGRV
jgi:hypothetical protein